MAHFRYKAANFPKRSRLHRQNRRSQFTLPDALAGGASVMASNASELCQNLRPLRLKSPDSSAKTTAHPSNCPTLWPAERRQRPPMSRSFVKPPTPSARLARLERQNHRSPVNCPALWPTERRQWTRMPRDFVKPPAASARLARLERQNHRSSVNCPALWPEERR